MAHLQTYVLSLWFVISVASPSPAPIETWHNDLPEVFDGAEFADARADAAAEIKDAPRFVEEISNLRKLSFEADMKDWDNISERCKKNSVTPVSCSTAQLGPDGLLPHPDDCGLFYYCVGRELPPVCRDCPAHLHFNPAQYVCDEPASAGCTASPTTPAPALQS